MSEPDLAAAREQVAAFGRELLEQGLTTGTGGNLSVRAADGRIAISPTGVPYGEIEPEDVAVLSLDGEHLEGLAPSSETPMHAAVLDRRPGIDAVVHTHSPYATTFAVLGEPIPASHYLVAHAGDRVPVTDQYVDYGTEALAETAVEALGQSYDACLLRNHGSLAVGDSLEGAFETALMVEFCARIHYQARAIGEPETLPGETMERIAGRFDDYGQAE